jgi:hypothetical protein
MTTPHIARSVFSRPRRVSGLLLVVVTLTTGIFALLQSEVADASRHRAGNGRVVNPVDYAFSSDLSLVNDAKFCYNVAPSSHGANSSSP